MGARGSIPASDDQALTVIRLTFGCDDAVADTIAALAHGTVLAQGAVLWPREETGSSILIVTGLAQEVAYGRDGGMLVLHSLGPGDLFGDLMDGGSDSETRIEGVADGRGAQFASSVIVRLMDSYSCVGMAITRQLSRRLAGMRNRMVETALLSVTGRICSELLRRCANTPDRTIRPMPVMSELATSVHSTRETVSRTVSQLERRGMVRRVAGGLEIVAPHRLQEQAY